MRAERDRLMDILGSIAIIEKYTAGMDSAAFVSAFDRDRLRADTVCYRFIVIGEGINALLGNPQSGLAPATIIARYPDIDWKGYAALRNIVTHQYFRLAPNKIWAAIESELPVLKKTVETALQLV
jgi:uncharacterized protein with HEPN domain